MVCIVVVVVGQTNQLLYLRSIPAVEGEQLTRHDACYCMLLHRFITCPSLLLGSPYQSAKPVCPINAGTVTAPVLHEGCT